LSIFDLDRENLTVLIHDLNRVEKISPLCSIEQCRETKNLNLAHAWFIVQATVLLLKWLLTIEIALEQAPFVVLVYFSPSFEHSKNLPIMGPNNTKNSSLKKV
jgi:hypothetical protein